MPFQSEKQRRYLHANHPEIAQRWEKEYSDGGIAALNAQLNQLPEYYLPLANGGVSQLVQPGPGRPGYRGDAAYASKSEQSKKEYGGQGQTAKDRGDTGPRDYGETWGYVPPPKKKIIKTDDKEPPIKKKKKKKNKTIQTIEDTLKTIGSKMGIHPLLNRRLHYNMALKLPGSKDRVKNYRKKYKEYLDNIGAESPSTLGDKDLFSFWQSDAFNYQPSTGMDYGAFLIDKYDNPTVTMGGDVGNFYAMENPDWFKGSDIEWETKKRDIIEDRGYSTGEGDEQIPLWMKLGFNSEDEYLASLADGGVARKNYFHGGILDINESEEIISDDGNDIELTDYNAAFDDPNDLSTGVKSLFRAKNGGRIGLQGGGADQGGWGPGVGSPGTTSSGGNVNTGGSDRGPRDDPAPRETAREQGIQKAYEVTAPAAAKERQRKEDLKNLVETGPGSPTEKYDTPTQHLADTPGDLDFKSSQHNPYKSGINVDYKRTAYEQTLASQKAKLKKMGMGKLGEAGLMLLAMVGIYNISFTDALKYLPKTISLSKEDLGGLIKFSLPVMKAKKELIAALENHKGGLLKDVNIHNPNEMVNLEKTTDFTKTMDEINDLTKPKDKEDDKGDPAPPEVIPIGEEIEEYAEGDDYFMSPWKRIKANQAKRALLVRKGIIQENPVVDASEDNPIVDESVTDINMEPNKGGLANLFRVKNQ